MRLTIVRLRRGEQLHSRRTPGHPELENCAVSLVNVQMRVEHRLIQSGRLVKGELPELLQVYM